MNYLLVLPLSTIAALGPLAAIAWLVTRRSRNN